MLNVEFSNSVEATCFKKALLYKSIGDYDLGSPQYGKRNFTFKTGHNCPEFVW
jgi:hypothetical protein